MGQTFSNIVSNLTIPDDQQQQHQKKTHYTDVQAYDISVSKPFRVTSTIPRDFIPPRQNFSNIVRNLTIPDDQQQQQQQKTHYTDVQAYDISVSKPFRVTSTIPRDFIPPRPSLVGKQNLNDRFQVKRIGAYTSKQKILLVGEGDFSFSASLAVAFGSASNVTATSLNSQGFLMKNYGQFSSNKMKLQSRGGNVFHEIDAMTMVKEPILGGLKFDRIIFNFPHAGVFGRTPSDLKKHKELVRGFLRNAKKMIRKDGEIHVTHKTSAYSLQWDIPKIGSDQGINLIREVDFEPSIYPGYHTKYGFGGDRDFHNTPCKTYKFGLLLE